MSKKRLSKISWKGVKFEEDEPGGEVVKEEDLPSTSSGIRPTPLSYAKMVSKSLKHEEVVKVAPFKDDDFPSLSEKDASNEPDSEGWYDLGPSNTEAPTPGSSKGSFFKGVQFDTFYDSKTGIEFVNSGNDTFTFMVESKLPPGRESLNFEEEVEVGYSSKEEDSEDEEEKMLKLPGDMKMRHVSAANASELLLSERYVESMDVDRFQELPLELTGMRARAEYESSDNPRYMKDTRQLYFDPCLSTQSKMNEELLKKTPSTEIKPLHQSSLGKAIMTSFTAPLSLKSMKVKTGESKEETISDYAHDGWTTIGKKGKPFKDTMDNKITLNYVAEVVETEHLVQISKSVGSNIPEGRAEVEIGQIISEARAIGICLKKGEVVHFSITREALVSINISDVISKISDLKDLGHRLMLVHGKDIMRWKCYMISLILISLFRFKKTGPGNILKGLLGNRVIPADDIPQIRATLFRKILTDLLESLKIKESFVIEELKPADKSFQELIDFDNVCIIGFSETVVKMISVFEKERLYEIVYSISNVCITMISQAADEMEVSSPRDYYRKIQLEWKETKVGVSVHTLCERATNFINNKKDEMIQIVEDLKSKGSDAKRRAEDLAFQLYRSIVMRENAPRSICKRSSLSLLFDSLYSYLSEMQKLTSQEMGAMDERITELADIRKKLSKAILDLEDVVKPIWRVTSRKAFNPMEIPFILRRELINVPGTRSKCATDALEDLFLKMEICHDARDLMPLILRAQGLTHEAQVGFEMGLEYQKEEDKPSLREIILTHFPSKYDRFMSGLSSERHIIHAKADYYLVGGTSEMKLKKEKEEKFKMLSKVYHMRKTIDSDADSEGSDEDTENRVIFKSEVPKSLSTTQITHSEDVSKTLQELFSSNVLKKKFTRSGDAFTLTDNITQTKYANLLQEDSMDILSSDLAKNYDLIIIETGINRNAGHKAASDLEKWKPAMNVMRERLGMKVLYIGAVDSLSTDPGKWWIERKAAESIQTCFKNCISRASSFVGEASAMEMFLDYESQYILARLRNYGPLRTPLTAMNLKQNAARVALRVAKRPDGTLIPPEILQSKMIQDAIPVRQDPDDCEKIMDALIVNRKSISKAFSKGSLKLRKNDKMTGYRLYVGWMKEDLSLIHEEDCNILKISRKLSVMEDIGLFENVLKYPEWIDGESKDCSCEHTAGRPSGHPLPRMADIVEPIIKHLNNSSNLDEEEEVREDIEPTSLDEVVRMIVPASDGHERRLQRNHVSMIEAVILAMGKSAYKSRRHVIKVLITLDDNGNMISTRKFTNSKNGDSSTMSHFVPREGFKGNLVDLDLQTQALKYFLEKSNSLISEKKFYSEENKLKVRKLIEDVSSIENILILKKSKCLLDGLKMSNLKIALKLNVSPEDILSNRLEKMTLGSEPFLQRDAFLTFTDESFSRYLKNVFSRIIVNSSPSSSISPDCIYPKELLEAISERVTNLSSQLLEEITQTTKILLRIPAFEHMMIYSCLCASFLSIISGSFVRGTKILRIKHTDYNLVVCQSENKSASSRCAILDKNLKPIGPMFFLNKRVAALGKSLIYLTLIFFFNTIQNANCYLGWISILSNFDSRHANKILKKKSNIMTRILTNMKNLKVKECESLYAKEFISNEEYKKMDESDRAYEIFCSFCIGMLGINLPALSRNTSGFNKQIQTIRYPSMLSIGCFGFPDAMGKKLSAKCRFSEHYIARLWMQFCSVVACNNSHLNEIGWAEEKYCPKVNMPSYSLPTLNMISNKLFINDIYLVHIYNKEIEDYDRDLISIFNDFSEKHVEWEEKLKSYIEIYNNMSERIGNLKFAKLNNKNFSNSDKETLKKSKILKMKAVDEICMLMGLVKLGNLDRKSAIINNIVKESGLDKLEKDELIKYLNGEKKTESKEGSKRKYKRSQKITGEDNANPQDKMAISSDSTASNFTFEGKSSTQDSTEGDSSSMRRRIPQELEEHFDFGQVELIYRTNIDRLIENIISCSEKKLKVSHCPAELMQAMAQYSFSKLDKYNDVSIRMHRATNKSIPEVSESTSIVSEPKYSFSVEAALEFVRTRSTERIMKWVPGSTGKDRKVGIEIINSMLTTTSHPQSVDILKQIKEKRKKENKFTDFHKDLSLEKLKDIIFNKDLNQFYNVVKTMNKKVNEAIGKGKNSRSNSLWTTIKSGFDAIGFTTGLSLMDKIKILNEENVKVIQTSWQKMFDAASLKLKPELKIKSSVEKLRKGFKSILRLVCSLHSFGDLRTFESQTESLAQISDLVKDERRRLHETEDLSIIVSILFIIASLTCPFFSIVKGTVLETAKELSLCFAQAGDKSLLETQSHCDLIGGKFLVQKDMMAYLGWKDSDLIEILDSDDELKAMYNLRLGEIVDDEDFSTTLELMKCDVLSYISSKFTVHDNPIATIYESKTISSKGPTKSVEKILEVVRGLVAQLSFYNLDVSIIDNMTTTISFKQFGQSALRKLRYKPSVSVFIKSTRSKVIFEMVKVLLTYRDSNLQNIAFKLSQDVYTTIFYALAPKAQYGGGRDLVIQDTVTKILNGTSESLSESILNLDETDGLTNQNLGAQILKAAHDATLNQLRNDYEVMRFEESEVEEKIEITRTFIISGDNTKWGPIHCTSHFLRVFAQTLGDMKDWLAFYQIVMSKNTVKHVEIPNPIIVKFFNAFYHSKEYNQEEGRTRNMSDYTEKMIKYVKKHWSTHPNMEYIVKNYLSKGNLTMNVYNHMGQGIHHKTSSVITLLASKFITAMIEMWWSEEDPEVRVSVKHAGSSDDFCKVIVLRKIIFKSLTNPELVRNILDDQMLECFNFMFGLHRSLQMLVSDKSVISRYSGEYNSLFNIGCHDTPAECKFFTAQVINYTILDSSSSYVSNFCACQTAMFYGCSALTQLVLSISKHQVTHIGLENFLSKYGGILYRTCSALGEAYAPSYASQVGGGILLSDVMALRDKLDNMDTFIDAIKEYSASLVRSDISSDRSRTYSTISTSFESSGSSFTSSGDIGSESDDDEYVFKSGIRKPSPSTNTSGFCEHTKAYGKENDFIVTNSSQMLEKIKNYLPKTVKYSDALSRFQTYNSSILVLIMLSYYPNFNSDGLEHQFRVEKGMKEESLFESPFSSVQLSEVQRYILKIRDILTMSSDDSESVKEILAEDGVDRFTNAVVSELARTGISSSLLSVELKRLHTALQSKGAALGLSGKKNDISMPTLMMIYKSHRFMDRIGMLSKETWQGSRPYGLTTEEYKIPKVSFSRFLDSVFNLNTVICGQSEVECIWCKDFISLDISNESKESENYAKILILQAEQKLKPITIERIDPSKLQDSEMVIVIHELIIEACKLFSKCIDARIRSPLIANAAVKESCVTPERYTTSNTRSIKAVFKTESVIPKTKNSLTVVAASLINQSALVGVQPRGTQIGKLGQDHVMFEVGLPELHAMCKMIQRGKFSGNAGQAATAISNRIRSYIKASQNEVPLFMQSCGQSDSKLSGDMADLVRFNYVGGCEVILADRHKIEKISGLGDDIVFGALKTVLNSLHFDRGEDISPLITAFFSWKPSKADGNDCECNISKELYQLHLLGSEINDVNFSLLKMAQSSLILKEHNEYKKNLKKFLDEVAGGLSTGVGSELANYSIHQMGNFGSAGEIAISSVNNALEMFNNSEKITCFIKTTDPNFFYRCLEIALEKYRHFPENASVTMGEFISKFGKAKDLIQHGNQMIKIIDVSHDQEKYATVSFKDYHNNHSEKPAVILMPNIMKSTRDYSTKILNQSKTVIIWSFNTISMQKFYSIPDYDVSNLKEIVAAIVRASKDYEPHVSTENKYKEISCVSFRLPIRHEVKRVSFALAHAFLRHSSVARLYRTIDDEVAVSTLRKLKVVRDFCEKIPVHITSDEIERIIKDSVLDDDEDSEIIELTTRVVTREGGNDSWINRKSKREEGERIDEELEQSDGGDSDLDDRNFDERTAIQSSKKKNKSDKFVLEKLNLRISQRILEDRLNSMKVTPDQFNMICSIIQRMSDSKFIAVPVLKGDLSFWKIKPVIDTKTRNVDSCIPFLNSLCGQSISNKILSGCLRNIEKDSLFFTLLFSKLNRCGISATDLEGVLAVIFGTGLVESMYLTALSEVERRGAIKDFSVPLIPWHMIASLFHKFKFDSKVIGDEDVRASFHFNFDKAHTYHLIIKFNLDNERAEKFRQSSITAPSSEWILSALKGKPSETCPSWIKRIAEEFSEIKLEVMSRLPKEFKSSLKKNNMALLISYVNMLFYVFDFFMGWTKKKFSTKRGFFSAIGRITGLSKVVYLSKFDVNYDKISELIEHMYKEGTKEIKNFQVATLKIDIRNILEARPFIEDVLKVSNMNNDEIDLKTLIFGLIHQIIPNDKEAFSEEHEKLRKIISPNQEIFKSLELTYSEKLLETQGISLEEEEGDREERFDMPDYAIDEMVNIYGLDSGSDDETRLTKEVKSSNEASVRNSSESSCHSELQTEIESGSESSEDSESDEEGFDWKKVFDVASKSMKDEDEEQDTRIKELGSTTDLATKEEMEELERRMEECEEDEFEGFF